MTSSRTWSVDHLEILIGVQLNYDLLRRGKREHLLPPSYDNSGQREWPELGRNLLNEMVSTMHAIHEFRIGRKAVTIHSDNLKAPFYWYLVSLRVGSSTTVAKLRLINRPCRPVLEYEIICSKRFGPWHWWLPCDSCLRSWSTVCEICCLFLSMTAHVPIPSV